jgi:hypothetical protein
MRRHWNMMDRAIALLRTEYTEEQRKQFAADLVTTFENAQAAWGAYRQHLIEHGILPSPSTHD